MTLVEIPLHQRACKAQMTFDLSRNAEQTGIDPIPHSLGAKREKSVTRIFARIISRKLSLESFSR